MEESDFMWRIRGIRGERNYMFNYMVIICSLFHINGINHQLTAINGDPDPTQF